MQQTQMWSSCLPSLAGGVLSDCVCLLRAVCDTAVFVCETTPKAVLVVVLLAQPE